MRPRLFAPYTVVLWGGVKGGSGLRLRHLAPSTRVKGVRLMPLHPRSLHPAHSSAVARLRASQGVVRGG